MDRVENRIIIKPKDTTKEEDKKISLVIKNYKRYGFIIPKNC